MKKKKHVLRKLITVFCAAVLSIGMLNATTVDETIQAEDYSLRSGCAFSNSHAGYTGSGYLDYGGNGTWGEWTYTSPGAGTITLSVRYGNGSVDNRQCELTVNGSSEGNVAFVGTGSWTTWGVTTVDIDVVEGTNTIRLTANTSFGGANLDKLDLDGTVSGLISVTGVAVSPTSLTLEEGECIDLTETVSPANATDQSVAWSSSNAFVATVDANGLVCAVSAGNATITVTTNDGSFTANCAVTVNVPVISVTGVAVFPTALTLDEGQTSDLTETVSPANATDQSVAWNSSNTLVATVDANGLVTAVAAGSATITVTTNDGGFTANCAVTVNVPVTGVSVSPTTLTLDEGQTSDLTETVSPANATDQSVAWNSSNTLVATVDANGLVTAVAAGNATITVTTNDGGFTANCAVTVNVPVISVTGVSVFPTALTLDEGQTSDLAETISPANATDQSVAWSSSNASVAAVDAGGLVTALAEGNATITVTTNDGGFTANCAVTVNVPVISVTGVSVFPTTLTLDEGQTSDLAETISPANATDQSVAWSSSNASVAAVDASGLVTAVAEGNATITVTTNDGGFTANCAVTVNDTSSGIIIDETIQAEDYSSQSGCAFSTNKAGYTGSGFLDYGGNGTWGEWSTNISGNGTVILSLRYANGTSGDRQCEVTVNGASAGNVAFASTGSWTIWNTVTININVVDGANTVRITANTSDGGPNLDKLDLDGTGGGVDTEAPSIPTGLAAGTITETSVDLSWVASTDNVGVTGYKVYTDGANPQTVTGTSATISGLSASTQYSFTVSAIDAAGNESAQSAALSVTTDDPDTQAPSVPTSLASGNITTTSVDLSWAASTDNVGVTGYKVYTDGSNPQTVTGTSATISGLSASTQYSFTVSAIDAAGNESAQSAALSVTTDDPDTQVPSVPTGLAEGTVTWSSVALSWTASTDNVGVTGYKVYTDGSNPQTVTGTSATINGLSASTQYSFTVSAIDAAGNESAQSSAIDVTTQPVPSGITSNATWQSFQLLTITGLLTATFDAVPNGSGIDAVTGIQNGTASGYGDLACIVRFNSTGQIDARNGGAYAASNTINYTAGTSYHFRLEINVSTHTYFVYVTPQGGAEQIVASNFAFRSEQASVSQLTGWSVYALSGSHTVSNMVFTPAPPDTEAPSVPIGLASSDITSLSFTLNWAVSTDNVGVTGYEVFQDGVSLGTTANTSFPVTGLSPSTTYSMTVSALDGAGNESAQSAALNVTTDVPDTQAPSVPTGLAASGIYSTSFILSWDASTDNVGVTGYEVFKDGVSIGTTTQTTKYVGGLSATTTYSMTVRATDLAGNWSAQSAALNVTTSNSSGDWPNDSNTGPSGTLTAYSGDMTVTTDGTVIQNMNISGKIFVRANNVTIRNCKVSAVDVRVDYGYTGCLVEDCEMNWVGRGNMTMRRCKMRGQSVDLIRISGGDFIIEDCYLVVDGPKIEGAHADVIQSYPTATYNSIIRHNTLIAEDAVACINASDVTIENNLLIGGTYTIYGQRVTVINNHFSTQLYANCGKAGLYYTGNEADLWTGNIWHETGAPAPYPHLSSAQVEEGIALNETNVTKGITLYPNPLNGNVLNIKIDGYNASADIHVKIIDLTGRSVYNQLHSAQSKLTIPVDNLSKGIYIVSVNGNRQKLIIE